MGYATLAACVADMEKHGHLVRITAEVDPHLELAAIQRRAFRLGAPAMLFTNVKGCSFSMAANLFATRERLHFIFRDALPRVRRLFALKACPGEGLRHPIDACRVLPALWHMLPRRTSAAPVLECRASVGDLPRLVSWPGDGGAFVTLPLVYSEHPDRPGHAGSNLGMYRVQLDGNDYAPDEVGLHYQIHRGIGTHHAAALARGGRLPVRIFVGGPPALTLAAVMPLPEGLPELLFAGVLGGGRISLCNTPDFPLPVVAEADFCISGYVEPGLKPEGPFGDHVGYYSLRHDFPVLKVRSVHHRREAIWPFTTVGRPPQEDTLFGEFIHELTADLVPQVFAGVREVHAVDAAGVHPLLLVLGSERYAPYEPERTPRELVTCGLHVLGTTQTALAKYVLVAAHEDDSRLTTHDVPHFFRHMLERTDFRRDLRCITSTPTDTLDYTGTALNEGSKLLWTAAGKARRTLGTELGADMPLPDGFTEPRLLSAGIVAVRGPVHTGARGDQDSRLEDFAQGLAAWGRRDSFPLVVVVDSSTFATRNWENFLWTVFTRSDPAADIYGAGGSIRSKHWGCDGPLVIDARLKCFQAPPLEEDPDVERRVDALGAPGGPLHGWV
ncbi:MAG: UbiD family decarboxylase [Desulfovibrionaceae bacterium]|nr:UbiD family decarboxylase [Desulfovibrionaceae bacterium]